MKQLLAGGVLLFVFAMNLFAAVREAEWKQVEAAISQGLPQTAITNLNLIIPAALKDKAYGEAAKAIARKIVLEGNIQGNKPEEKITRMEAEIARAPKELLPLLDTILANWYWHYFQNNRWRFIQRTATAIAPGKDFTTWDLPRLFAEIDKQFTKALEAADTLKSIPIAQYDDLLPKGALPDSYRPTLYDFIAHEALKFYASGEQAMAKPEDAFELLANKPVYGIVPIFGIAEEFMAGKIERRVDESAIEKALFIFRDLLLFHRNDANRDAFADADLARLVWAHNTAFGEDRSVRYKAALTLFVEKWAGHEVSALALHYWARVLQSEGSLVEARGLAERGEENFPQSTGGKMCHNLIAEIEARSATITTERVWNAPWPKIQIQYRNVTNVYFRAVAYDWAIFLEKRHSRPESLNDAEREELLGKMPIFEWVAKLPPTSDFKPRTEELPAPDSLRPGYYFIIASHDPNFSDRDNQVTFTDVWVSELALVVRPRNGAIEGFVLEANSGEPVKGAELMAWFLDNNGNRVPNGPAVSTDENGFFAVSSRENRGLLLRARHNGRELASQQEYSSWKPQPDRLNDQTIFFTDRALYRTGQTIQYKGIAVRVDTEKDNYETLAGRRVSVVFADPNGKEIAKAEHQCNDYGSFSGSFTAPRDRVLGTMRIYHSGQPQYGTHFNVEEYKRPKFQVTLDAPKVAAKLNEQVSLPGKAESYTGAAVDGAKVKWRVVREVRWPVWWGWYSWRSPRAEASQEIAHGTATTGADGAFQVEFVAKPDPSVAEKDEASFNFSIYADVTDTTGETRSANRSVNIGFAALTATMSASEWQTSDQPVELKILTATLDGEPQSAEGAVKIYRLKQPLQVQRVSFGVADDSTVIDPNTGAVISAELDLQDDGESARQKRDLSNPNNWELGEVVVERSFSTDVKGELTLTFTLGPAAYRAMLETKDRFGKKVTGRLPLQVLQPNANKLAIKIPHLLAAPDWSREPGQEFMALWGTGYDAGRAFVEIEHRGRMLQRYWTKAGDTQAQIKQAVTEAMRGGFTLHVTQVRENRAYLDSRHVEVPWSNKHFDVKWEHFTSKLQPAQQETWTLSISNLNSQISNSNLAELVATLYDASLDQFLPHYWQQRFGFFHHDYSSGHGDFVNTPKGFQHLRGQWTIEYVDAELRYREFPPELVQNFWGFEFGRYAIRSLSAGRGGGGVMEKETIVAAGPNAVAVADRPLSFMLADEQSKSGKRMAGMDGPPSPPSGAVTKTPDLSQVTARKNLNETAFFFPHLLSDSNGVVKLQFTMPEALTQWKFMGFAHDAKCRSGFLEGKAVTAKDLMVQPNPPRFLREGDMLEFTVKVSNQSAARQEGSVKLTFTDARTEQSADALLNIVPLTPSLSPTGGEGARRAGEGAALKKRSENAVAVVNEIAFDLPAKESRSYSWRIKVPDGCPFLTYKAVASTGKISDGEEGYLPVLSRRIFVTESLPLPIRGKAGGPVTKKFSFEKLLASGKSSSLVHRNLTVQMVSNPSWYAVMALPYLMEFPHECSEQTFNRLYANALARSIATSDPKIHRVFEQWRGTPALDSPLEKNQDLKAVMLEETPWLRQANNESQARKNIGILFDDNRLNSETTRLLAQLAEMQLPDGSWPWFPGGRGNDYITLYITTGFGRLRHLGVDIDIAPAVKSLTRLDGWMDEHYHNILKTPHPELYVPSSTDALYLYGRSFFLKDRPIPSGLQAAVNFFLAQSRKHWLKVNDRQSQGHLAIAVKRFNASTQLADSAPSDIMRSIKERSVTNEEMGMFWRETELSWWWYRAPIETQALMIEAFDEVMGDKQAVEECKVWLLKQKQTQDWKTTKATADAVYALLLRGKDVLASDSLVEVSLGGQRVLGSRSPAPPGRGSSEGPRSKDSNVSSRPGTVNGSPSPGGEGGRAAEAGTGFQERRFAGSEIKPRLGDITVRKIDEGIAWGSVHWQYLEDMSKVTPHEDTPLKLKKSLHTKTNTKKGPVLEPARGSVQVGDELVVRIELRVDRDMEYVHLKDQRGSGTEPANVLSRYKYQDGLAYYETTRDTASHFFIDYLPKGAYVFEYSTRVQHRGQYQTGVAEIQCMYAPEFNSHSESLPLVVK